MAHKNKDDHNAYNRAWRKNNPEKIRQLRKQDYIAHKKKRDKASTSYRNRHPWLRHYTNAKQRCTNPKHPSYKYYGAKGIKFELTVEEIKKLWYRDKGDKMKRPSIDRREVSLNYTFDNCRFIELYINVGKKVDSK